MAGKETGARVLGLLRQHYPGSRTALKFRTPLEMLLSTVLSAQCTDARVNRVTAELFKSYRSTKDYAYGDVGRLESLIRPTGFFRSKARNIMAAARMIVEDFGGAVPDSMESLVRLPGVGRKTANIVLWNSFGIIGGIAVDTHVKRVAFRIGLTGSRDPVNIERDLMALFRKEDWPHLSNLLIEHGRAVCRARRPLCRECFLFRLCEKKGVDREFWINGKG